MKTKAFFSQHITPLCRVWIMMFVFCFSFASISDWAWGQQVAFDMPAEIISPPPYSSDNPAYVTVSDDAGNIYNINQVRAKRGGGGATEWVCSSGGNFDVTFYFEDEGTTLGFNDVTTPAGAAQTLGETRRDVLCQVVQDLSYLIAPSLAGCSNERINLRIQVLASYDDSSNPTLGLSKPYHYNYGVNTQGLSYNSVWRYLNGGDNPTSFLSYSYDDYFYHAALRFNFGHNFYYDLTQTPADDPNTTNDDHRFDFYTVVLHEMMHTLGFRSAMHDNGTGLLSGNNMYTNYDQYLTTSSPLDYLLDHLDDCYSWTFDDDLLSNLTNTSCNSLVFHSPSANANYPVFTADATEGWMQGSSCSHLQTACYGTYTANDAYFLMNPYSLPNTYIRRPTPEELHILCDLGYATTSNYGNGNLPFHSQTLASCGTNDITAAVDDPCHYEEFDDGKYHTTACSPITLSYGTDILNNDHNSLLSNNSYIDCVNVEYGGGTVAVDNITGTLTYNPNNQVGLHVISYIASNAAGKQSNPAFIFIQADYCLDTNPFGCDVTDLDNTCNLICNPDLSDPCNIQPCQSGLAVFALLNPNGYCNFKGWGDIVAGEDRSGTADYYDGSNTVNPPTDAGALGISRVKAYENPNWVLKSEVLATGCQLEAGKRYVLSYVRRSANAINFTASGLCATDSWTEIPQINSLNIYAANIADLSSAVAATTSLNAELPINLPYSTTEEQTVLIDNDFNDFDWKTVSTCFTANANHDALYMYITGENFSPLDLTLTSYGYALIDRFDVFEDDFVPDATFSVECPATILIGKEVCLPIADVSYSWQMSVDGGNTWTDLPSATDNQTQIEVTPTTNTLYQITRTSGSTPCLNTSSIITVNVSLQTNITGNTTICVDNATTLSATSGFAGYHWSTSATTQSITVSPNITTTYTVTVTDTNGCTATASTTVTVNALPTPTIEGATSFCAGSSTTLTASGGGTYAWSSGLGSNTTATITTAGTYTVTVTDTNGCTATASTVVTVQTCTPLDCVANTAYLTFNGGNLNYTAPTGTAIWQPTNNPFGAGLGTPANPIRINGDITIPAGADITLKNLNFEFGNNGRIVVLRGNNPTPGGILRLDGCTLTGNPICNTMWQGIQIQGPGAQEQANAFNSGSIRINPANAPNRIEHAIIAVANTVLPLFDFSTLTQQISLFSTGDASNIGINLSSATLLPSLISATALANSGGNIALYGGETGFLNKITINSCFYGVYLGPYTPNTPSTFVNKVTFETTSSLRYPFTSFTSEAGVVGHLFLQAAFGVNHCEFNNLVYGVRLNASVAASIRNNIFNNCKIGISARSFSFLPQATTQIKTNTFNLNRIAIQGDGIITNVEKNIINGDNQLPTYNAPDVGILLRSSDFVVGSTDPLLGNTISNTNLGIIIANSDQNGNEVRNNTINNTLAGILVADRNNSLQLACNNLNNYTLAGIGVRGWTATNADDDGVIPQQGDCVQSEFFNPAANDFQTVFSPIADILRALGDSQPFEYYDVASVIAGLTANDPDILQNCVALTPDNWTREGYCGYPKIESREAALAAPTEDLKNMLANDLLRKYRADSNFVAATQFLEELQNRMAKRLLVADYYAQDDANTADQKLESILRQTQEDEDFYAFYKILISLKQDTKTLFELNPDQETTLLSIANHHTNTAYKAQTLLYLLRGYEFPLQIPTIDGSMAYTVFKTQTDVPYFSDFYPNPAQNTAELRYQLADNTQVELCLYNINGMLLHQAKLGVGGSYVLNTAPYQSGVYMYTISNNNKVERRGKLVIIK